MHHAKNFLSTILRTVDNDTKTRAWCGSTAIACIVGQPISVVRDALRVVRYGENWTTRSPRAPAICGITRYELENALRIFGVFGRWEAVQNGPTLAAWLDRRTQAQFRSIIVARVTNHFLTVSGEQFVDTFTKGDIVHIDEAPRRRKRVKDFFIITHRKEQGRQLDVIHEIAAKRKALREREKHYYLEFKKSARRNGVVWSLDRFDHEITMRIPGGRSLRVTHHGVPWDWGAAHDQLEAFLGSPEIDRKRFEMLDRDGKAWGALDS